MRSRLAVAALSVASLVLALTRAPAQPPDAAAAAPETCDLPFSTPAWDFRQLDLDPTRLVKATYDPRTEQVKLVLEFQRSLRIQEDEWAGPRGQMVATDRDGNAHLLSNVRRASPPFLVRFLDEDGVAVLTVRPRFDGEVVGLQGQRARLLVPLPAKALRDRTRWVLIDRLYGDF
jgi:hypothetical protein